MSEAENNLKVVLQSAINWCSKYGHDFLDIVVFDKERANAHTDLQKNFLDINIGYEKKKPQQIRTARVIYVNQTYKNIS